MNTLIRNLKWKPEGYQPIGYEWKNYRANHNPLALAHDLYEHQIGESGTWTEEFRAFGASVWFDEHRENIVGNNAVTYANHFTKMLKHDEIDPKYFIDVEGFHSDINYFAYYLMYTSNPRYLRNILMSGYNHAKQFTQEAWKKVASYDFFSSWAFGNDLEIDLVTGSCKEISNRMAIQQIRKAEMYDFMTEKVVTLVDKI